MRTGPPGCFRGLCQLWEKGSSDRLPRGATHSKAQRNGLSRMTKSGSHDSGTGREWKVPKHRTRQVLFGGERPLFFWAYKSFLYVRVLTFTYSIYCLFYHLTLVLLLNFLDKNLSFGAVKYLFSFIGFALGILFKEGGPRLYI